MVGTPRCGVPARVQRAERIAHDARTEQGATIGVAQSFGSLARILGPLFAATLYTWVAPLPYVVCGAISIFTGALAWQRSRTR
jgi:hypothetical protein